MNKEELNKLGKLIRSKRISRGFTQNELAIKSGVNKNYIGMLERGERNSSYLSLKKIADGLGLTIYELLTP